MSKSIHTLVKDIQDHLSNDPDFLQDVGRLLVEHPPNKERQPTLRLSQMGDRCPKALWHSLHTPELAEPLPPGAKFKYSFGHMIEAAAITLAKQAGHEVTGEQDELTCCGITGHRDCVIDGCVVDVKSASSFSFAKFKDKSIATEDSFGYLSQLDGYLLASRGDPLVRDSERGYLLAVDKTLGHMVLYEHTLREQHIKERIEQYKRIAASDSPPSCTCGTRPSGKSGNIELDTKASYNLYKYCCFPHLRTFRYAGGVVHLTKVARKPEVLEIDRTGKIVYAG